MFANMLSRYWWMTLLRGTCWILFGIAVFSQPGITLITLALFFGVVVLADGVGSVVIAIGARKNNDDWWVLLLAGMAGIGVGLVTLTKPGVTALALLFYIAIWAIASGLLAIVGAIRLRKEITGEFWMALGGVLSIAFGTLLVVRPGAGVLSLLWVIGAYAFVFGVTLVLLAFRTRGSVKQAGGSVSTA